MDLSGYRGEKITLKSDGEPSIVAIREAVVASRVGESPFLTSPVRESVGNAEVERAVRTWQGQFRTLKHFYEYKMGMHQQGKVLALASDFFKIKGQVGHTGPGFVGPQSRWMKCAS